MLRLLSQLDMELDNQTIFSAMLFRGGIDENRFAASVMARVTYDIIDGQLEISEEQPWETSPGPWECEYGPMDSDEVIYKDGVDVLVFGSARAPGGNSQGRINLTIEVGNEFRREIVVFGDRVWEQDGERLVPSEPKPFSEMPLTLAHAFGGSDEWDELPIPFSSNPDGMGYYLEAENAMGKPLPNLEDPDHLIASWEDQPDPVAVAPVTPSFGPRLREGVIFDEETGAMTELRPCFYNAASPPMISPPVSAGERVTIDGVLDAGPLSFVLPNTRLMVRLAFDDEVIERPLAIDQIGIEPDKQRVFIAYRYPFRYVMIPKQKRSCVLEHLENNADTGREAS